MVGIGSPPPAIVRELRVARDICARTRRHEVRRPGPPFGARTRRSSREHAVELRRRAPPRGGDPGILREPMGPSRRDRAGDRAANAILLALVWLFGMEIAPAVHL